MPRRFTQSTAQTSSSDDSLKAVILFFTAIILTIVTVALDITTDGRWAFFAAISMSICLEGALWYAVIKNDHRCFCLKFAFVAFLILKVFPLGACLSLGRYEDYLFPQGEFVFEAPLQAALSGSVRGLSIAFVFLVTRPFSPPRLNDVPILRLFKSAGPYFELILITAGGFTILHWVAVSGLNNPVFYFVRIFNKVFEVVPFFVGLLAFRYKKATVVWLFVIAIQIGISLITGSRGHAFYPILYFMIGFGIGLPTWASRVKWATVVFPLAIAAAVLGSFIGSARTVTGRTNLMNALNQGVSVISATDDTIVKANMRYRGNQAFEVCRRLTMWVDYVVPAMTPDPIPYRGYQDFTYEVRAAFQLGIFALLDRNFSGAYYFGNIFLKEYGFAVHVDAYGKKVSNVPLPVQIDAFMRGGWVPAFGFTIFGCFVFFVVERLARNYLYPNRDKVFLIWVMVLSYLAYERLRTSSLVDTLRYLALEGTFALICFIAYDYAVKRYLPKLGRAWGK